MLLLVASLCRIANSPQFINRYAAPGVLVFYSPEGMDNPTMVNKFLENGMQIAMGVPWMIDEGATQTWRIGLFGVDKLADIDGTVRELEKALDKVMKS